MKKNLIFFAAFLVLLAGCTKDVIRGSGAVISDERNTPAFQKIEFFGEGEVIVSFGNEQRVTVEGYQNLVPLFETQVVGNTLTLKYRHEYQQIRNSNIRVHITTPDIKGVILNGSGDINFGSGFNGTELSSEINGSGTIYSGNGKFVNLRVKINGSGNADLEKLVSDNAEATINGSGTIRVLSFKSLKGKIAGSGTIHYSGNPLIVETEVNGSGRLVKH
jgi:hypothetical protein